MLELAAVGPRDVVYDVGCGDGRMVIAAAKIYGARGVGIEIDPVLLEECRAGARREGVESLVRFVEKDALKASLTGATVLALYLLPESLETLSPVFERDLAPGVRIVSHDYAIPGWTGRRVRSEVVKDESGREHKIHLYRMPEGK
jgi:cyclopropane fatty-acyl-phospholipid synthase-like methyltransferase